MDFINKELVDAIELQSKIGSELATLIYAYYDKRTLENKGKVMSRSRLEEGLYAWNDEVESNTVEVHIHHIRKKLGAKLIRTIRGVGYIVDK